MKTSHTVKAGLTSLVLISALVACGAAGAPLPSTGYYNVEETRAEAPAAPAAKDGVVDSSVGGAAPQAAQPRLIVRNASLSLVVTDVPAQVEAIAQIAKDYNGFIVSSNSTTFGNDTRANVVLRVESDKLDNAIGRLRAMAIEVRNLNVTGEDVTAEFVDLDAQLKNLESAEAQLKKIMEQTEKSEDVLAVFKEITAIRGQIDQIKGRMKYLSQSAALATVSVELIPDAAAQPVEPPAWRPGGTLNRAVEALIRSLQGLVDIAIYLGIAVLPILLLLIAPFVLLFWLLRRISRNRKARTSVTKATVAAQAEVDATKP